MKQNGFSLIEMIIFILVTSILAVGIFLGFNQILTNITFSEDNYNAAQMAKERMEILLAERDNVGFIAFNVDPCAGGAPPPMCAAPANYNIVTSIVANVDPNFKTITVTVSGRGNATLITQVANYG